ncbi:hypothetical protein LXA43DRAFT_82522 [Ganoderma leucocontextum]|nr:hypothetical protein LXA43DRAFT_82522 [Ganoderma leucocontextum]
MPRLRELVGSYLPISETSPFALLLSPTLRVLDLRFALENKEENRLRFPHIASSLLQTLPLMVPDLEHLSYGAPFNLGQEYLRHFTRLKSLSAPPNPALNEHRLQILSSITTLQNLSCFIDLSGISSLAFPPHAFQQLTELTIRGYSDHLVTFLLACRLLNLVRINLRSHITQQPSARQPRDMFSAVCQCCNPTLLTSFAADFTHRFASRPSSLMEYLEPLLALPNITSFHLVFFLTEPSIRDDDLARFSAAWPHLASFRVLHRTKQYSEHDVARPTLAGIIELARRCPRLTTFHIPEVDAGVVPENGAVPPLGHGLRSALIENIVPPMSSQAYLEVATVLDRVFPKIDLEDARSMVSSVHGRGWAEVLRFMEAMRLGRDNGVVYADHPQG